MSGLTSLLQALPGATYFPFLFAFLLLLILIVSFRSRAIVFCQYLKRMTGIELSPGDVKRVYDEKGPNGVRDLFLDLIIREDLKQGTAVVPPTVSKSSQGAP